MSEDKTNLVDDSVELPKAKSTLVDGDFVDSSYATKENETLVSAVDENTSVKENPNAGHRNPGLDAMVLERRQPKLTEKGRAYRLDGKKGQRTKLKREMKFKMANIIVLIGLDRNIELVGNESLKLNELFDNFSNVHEEIQELFTTEEQLVDS